MGGKNSFFNKPLGVGKQSVKHNPLNVAPVVSGTIGPSDKSGVDLWGGKSLGKEQTALGIASNVFGSDGEQADGSVNSLSKGDIEGFMKQGRAKGEELTGTTSAEVGAGRADVRSRLQETLNGNSVGANSLRQSQNASMKDLKSNQAMAGGGQMNAGQQQALQRQGGRDLAEFRGQENRQALSDISKEFRGAGQDIMKSEGQYGSILIGSQSPAQAPQSGGGIFDKVFGGLF
jgi:hypothetical protein